MNKAYDLSAKFPDYEWKLVPNKKGAHWMLSHKPRKHTVALPSINDMFENISITDNSDAKDVSGTFVVSDKNNAGNTQANESVTKTDSVNEDSYLSFVSFIDIDENVLADTYEFDLGDDDYGRFLKPQIINLEKAPSIKLSKNLPTWYYIKSEPLPDELSVIYQTIPPANVYKPCKLIKYKKMGGRYNCVFEDLTPVEATKMNIKAVVAIHNSNATSKL
jgi:hypothetical protein